MLVKVEELKGRVSRQDHTLPHVTCVSKQEITVSLTGSDGVEAMFRRCCFLISRLYPASRMQPEAELTGVYTSIPSRVHDAKQRTSPNPILVKLKDHLLAL